MSLAANRRCASTFLVVRALVASFGVARRSGIPADLDSWRRPGTEAVLRGRATKKPCHEFHHGKAFRVLPDGLERDSVSNNTANDLRRSQNHRAANSGAFFADSGQIDADLVALIDAWPALPRAVRQSIAKLAKVAAG
jgi:hypothetical protein